MPRYPEYACVYIMASSYQVLYVGVTTELEIRVRQHKEGRFPGSFTSRYKVNKLVYFERYPLIVEAISREKQLKGWLRRKKIALIVASNPTWRDLSLEWGQPSSRRSQVRPRPLVDEVAECGDPSLRSG
jgi:putative endonuclease